MKMLQVVLMLTLIAGCSSNDDDGSGPVILNDDLTLDQARLQIIGSWSFLVEPASSCEEIQTFGTDNDYVSIELDERVEGRYFITPNEQDDLLLVISIDSTNEQPNCEGQNIVDIGVIQGLLDFPDENTMTLTNIATKKSLNYTRVTSQ